MPATAMGNGKCGKGSKDGGCVFLASGYKWVTIMHEISISSAPIDNILPYPRTQ